MPFAMFKKRTVRFRIVFRVEFFRLVSTFATRMWWGIFGYNIIVTAGFLVLTDVTFPYSSNIYTVQEYDICIHEHTHARTHV